MEKPLAVVLVSGGMDSCVTAAIAREEHRLALLHASYGQRTQRRELQAFNAIAEFYGAVEQMVVSLEHLSAIGGSSLTDSSIPIRQADLKSQEIPASYVPFRNANMLSASTKIIDSDFKRLLNTELYNLGRFWVAKYLNDDAPDSSNNIVGCIGLAPLPTN